jgi:hypothetical protein
MPRRQPLALVPPAGLPARDTGHAGDFGLLAFLLAVGLVPIAGVLSGGHFGEGTVGLATVVSILCVRGIVVELRVRAGMRRRIRGAAGRGITPASGARTSSSRTVRA